MGSEMGNQSSNDLSDARSSRRDETSSKEGSETWEDLIVKIQLDRLSRVNSFEAMPKIKEEHRSDPQSSVHEKAESKGGSDTWEDVIEKIQLEVAKSFRRSPSIGEIRIAGEEVTSLDAKGQTSAQEVNGVSKSNDVEESEALEVSTMPSVEGPERGTHMEELDVLGHGIPPSEPGSMSYFDAIVLSDNPTVIPTIQMIFTENASSDGQHSETGLASGDGHDADLNKVNDCEESDLDKLRSPLPNLLEEESHDGKSSDGSKEPLLENKKPVHKSHSLRERITSFRSRGRQNSGSFSFFTCGACWAKEDPCDIWC